MLAYLRVYAIILLYGSRQALFCLNGIHSNAILAERASYFHMVKDIPPPQQLVKCHWC